MKRLLGWETLLIAHFNNAREQEFKWGTFDCALAVCDGVKAITGVDPGADYRGKYSSEAEAFEIIGTDLGKFTAGICDSLGIPEHTRHAFGRRGDVALVDNGNPTHALGTIDLTGRFAWCASGPGFIRVPMNRWLRAWRIA